MTKEAIKYADNIIKNVIIRNTKNKRKGVLL